jgi:uncharacterized iron-regulated membrane protein
MVSQASGPAMDAGPWKPDHERSDNNTASLMKVFFRNIHLYLGLAAGLVIAIVCFTGAMLEFEKEAQSFIYAERFNVAVGPKRVPVEDLLGALKKLVPSARVTSVKIYGDPTRSVEINYTEGGGGGKSGGRRASDASVPQGSAARRSPAGVGEGRGGEARPAGATENRVAYADPYTGAIIGLHSSRSPFFATMFSLHRWLLMGDTGKLIVGISTICFLFILITGIILWWPKNKRILRQHLKLRLGAGWKRINHDLHIVIGFYTSIVLFAIAFTGLAWSFRWFNDGIYWATGSKVEQPKPPLSKVVEGAAPVTVDRVHEIAGREIPGAEYYTITRPRESDGAFRVTVMPKDAAHERAYDQLYIDQYSGAPISTIRYGDQSLGQRVRTTFYPIHVGSIGGLPGRVLAFLCCLAGFTFPITGTILWINRLRTKRRVKLAKSRVAGPRPSEAVSAEVVGEEEVMS